MKYIKFKRAGYVIFEDTQDHDLMAIKFPCDEVISAGFIKSYADNEGNPLNTFGESATLNIKSQGMDAEHIYRKLIL